MQGAEEKNETEEKERDMLVVVTDSLKFWDKHDGVHGDHGR